MSVRAGDPSAPVRDASPLNGAAGGAPDPLRAALAQLSEGVIVTDATGRITFVNDAAARLHGVAKLDVAPEQYTETYHLCTEDGRPYPPADLPLARAVLRGETVVDARWRIRRPDGSEVLAVGSATPVVGPDGARLGAVLTIRDDTARAATLDALRERDALADRLRAAFEQSPVSTVVYDATGRPLAANPAFERLWGAGMADVPPDYSVLADPQLETAGVLPLLRRAFAGEAVTLPPVRYEMASAVGRGRVLWTQAHLYPVRDRGGAVEQVVLTHEDVTGRQEADAAQVEAVARAERLQALTAALSTASTPDQVAAAVVAHATAVFGAAGILVARVSQDGRELEIMGAGAMPDEIRDSWRHFPLDAPVPLAEVARTGEPLFLESREAWAARYPDMAPLLAAAGHHANAVAPLVVDGRVLGVLGAAFDAPREFTEVDRALTLTVAQQCAQALERARLFEAERAARAEAEAANRAKGEFLAAMSHELRTPLNAIAGHAQLLDMGLHGPVTPAQHDALARIELAQRHLLRHVNDVLNFARLQAGRLEYDVGPVPLAEVVGELEPLVAPQLRAKTLAYSAEVPAGCVVRADRDKLVQVLLNLLSNAVKFTPAGGRVSISCAHRAGDPEDAATVFLQVADTGVGIPRDKFDAVFEPFVQVDASPAGRVAGAGLGLAISRDLARGMGGDLRVRSDVGVGTTFTVTLPRA